MQINGIVLTTFISLRLAAYANSSGQKNCSRNQWWYCRL